MGFDILEGLNREQREAVEHVSGPLLILAGAGSGKTKVITHRVAHLISQAGVPPYRILAVTFTNKAAQEMRSRVIDLVGPVGHGVWVSTFHSLCARILRSDIETLGYRRSFSILDESDQVAAMKRVLEQLNISSDMFRPESVLSAISAAKNELIDAEQYAAAATDIRMRTIGKAYVAYQEMLAKDNALDFDDLIMLTVRLFRKAPEVLERYAERFTHVMVDEYQDTNHAQYVLVRMLASVHGNLCVVGDDDQSIYQWRGADIRNILEFERDYPNARVIKLEQNYRSTGNILNAANCVIANNRGRKRKSLWTSREAGAKVMFYVADTERDEARFIADETQRLVEAEGRSYGDFAVLYRMNAQSRVIEEVLVNRGIPYRIVGGIRFYERKEVKDVLAYLRVIENPDDSTSLERIINTPRRGIGDATLAVARRLALKQGTPLYEAVKLARVDQELGARARGALDKFVQLMDSLISLKGQATVSQIVQRIMDDTGYLAQLEQDTSIDAMSRVENLRELLSVTAEFEARHAEPAEDGSGGPDDLGAFLEEVALLTDIDRTDLGGDQVTLMTVHTAKGLEFPVVFMAGMEERIFPLMRAMYDEGEIEEERRLAYVGITRAKDKLYMTRAVTRTIFGMIERNEPSRFIREIPEHLLQDALIERYGYAHRQAPPARQGGLGWAGRTEGGEAARPAFAVGDKIRHGKFGLGVVVSVGKSAGDDVITVAFPDKGLKQFLVDMAPIERL
ncbi:MAG: DNA helicase PcrA [Bacillota bacterium]|jgi:DNA helicase-2/ATP-dependent DNA helicase PcrA|nr:DNA helicase PcrA [Bacillota bacterium]